MKYKELIQFEPVTEVIQLRSADQIESAAHLVDTYVISDRMADVILNRLLPALRLDDQKKGRGLFIVGNYGTGKSHLMSIISAVAEHVELLERVRHPAVKNQLSPIAGKFMVVRQETGATEMHLRDVVFSDLQHQLTMMGVNYTFPRMDEAPNNKQLLIDMMKKFSAVYPDKGLMIVLDELLDFLRARDEKELILDLNFLREVGETCELLPLRFIAGIQEALFDNSRFQFAADSIRRVKARFDQAMIVREDVAYVISHRLLTKTDTQKKTIRKHLEIFTPLYSEMAERLDLFIDLFPVHPAYIEMFEQVTIGERRDLLKALSSQMSELLDKPVPINQPGLITFDAYWRLINEDSAFRTIPEVRNVQDKAKVLSERIRQAPEMKEYREAALRIIDGLALHRLTVSDIYSPIGITPKEIRDRLCIHLDLPEEDADFLLATIETVMKAISMAVSGQFISHNSENDQYYLDLKKDIDFEALIDAKANTLAGSTLDRYYFEILVQALELTDSNYVPGFPIWERELAWPGHGITRRGYVFLGGSNDRSTAHPVRDFYLHFHALMGNGKEVSTYLADEVFYYLLNPEPTFITILKSYAGAKEMSAISAGSNKDQYDRKSSQLLSKLTQWMRENFIRSFKVRYQADELTITEAIARTRVSLRDLPFRDQVFRIGASLLDAHFSQKYPDYPRFEGVEFTSLTTWSAAEGALRALAGGPINKPSQAVLEGLQLGKFINGQIAWSIENSPYAAYYQSLVSGIQEGRVINRGELISGEPGAEKDVKFGLEPELLLVVLAALVRQGGISINLAGIQIAESDLSGASRIALDQLIRFTSISRPKPLPEQAVRELFSQMQITPESLSEPRVLVSALNQLQQKVQEELNGVVRMLESLRDGPKFWQKMILRSEEQQKWRKDLEEYRQFLTGVQSLSTPARLANLTQSVSELKTIFKTRKAIEELVSLFDALQSLRPVWDYLAQAQPLVPANHPWQQELKQSIDEVLKTLADPAKRNASGTMGILKGRLENVQGEYIKSYMALHNAARLDRTQDERKRQLTTDPRWARMRALSKLNLLPTNQLDVLQKRLNETLTCPGLQMTEMKSHTSCPHCGFNPVAEMQLDTADKRFSALCAEFEALCSQWIEILVKNLGTEEALGNMRYLALRELEAVDEFLHTRTLPNRINESFLNGIENALQGLEMLALDGTDFLFTITSPGMPCTPDELETRIREYLQSQLEGKDRRKLRIQINW